MDWIATDNITIPPDASDDYKYAAGIDYLEGNDCAVRHKKAVDLLREAAENGHEDALYTLVQLHRREIGLGLTPDGEIHWLKKLVDLAEERYYSEYHREFGETCCRYMEQLFTALYSLGMVDDAQEQGERWHRLATDMEERYLSLVPLATAELRLSDLFHYTGKTEMALMFCKNVYDRLLPYCDDYAASLMVLVCGAAERLSRRMFILSVPGGSDAPSQNAVRLEAALAETDDADREYHQFQLEKMRISFPMRSNAEDRKSLWLEQKFSYRKVLRAQEKYMRKANTTSAKDAFAEKCMEYANVCSHTDDPQGAQDYYQKAYGLWKELFDQRPRAQYQYLMAQCLRLQIPSLLRRWEFSQAERNAYRACALSAQLRDPELTKHSKALLAADYRLVYDEYMDRMLLEKAQELIFRLAVLEEKPDTSLVYLRHLTNLVKKGDENNNKSFYALAIYYYNAAILFAEIFKNRAPLLTPNYPDGLRVVIRGTVIGLYKKLGMIEKVLGNKDASRECHRMARYLRNQESK